MSVPVSATEELVEVVRTAIRRYEQEVDLDNSFMDLSAALAVWDLDKDLPEAAKKDRIEVQVPVPVQMSDDEVLDRAADILEDGLGDIKGFMRTANVKTLIRLLPELARKLRREKRKGSDD